MGIGVLEDGDHRRGEDILVEGSQEIRPRDDANHFLRWRYTGQHRYIALMARQRSSFKR